MSSAARVRTDPRISRRRRAIERSRRRRLIASCGAIAVVATGVWVAFWSPVLGVRHIQVVGARYVGPEDVASVARLSRDDNLLLVSPPDIASKVEELPWVREARVDRRLPGTVRVRIAERKAAIVLSAEGERWTLDRVGNVLAGGEAADGLPVVAGMNLDEVRPGIKLRQREVRDALAAWRSLAPRIRREVAAVLAPSPERITLSLVDGTQVRFGAARELRAKNEVLSALLGELRAEGTASSYIDVRVPTNPAVSTPPRETGAAASRLSP